MEQQFEKKRDNNRLIFFAGLVFLLALISYRNYFSGKEMHSFRFSGSKQAAESILQETSRMKDSQHPAWWLNSGGILEIGQDNFATNFGELPKDNAWRRLYAKNNSMDTDKGKLPQNIFRLVNRYEWQNYSQKLYFRIEKINLTDSPQRNESNGVLLFNRYQDGDNLYYTGVRVDGHAVIKKKIDGKYYTLKEKPVFGSDVKYDREDNPNLIPESSWIGIRSEVTNIGNNEVRIRLYLDLAGNGDWELVLEITDDDGKKGQEAFTKAGYAGIRTDFMDVKFKDYAIESL